jgi:hypothetical protein
MKHHSKNGFHQRNSHWLKNNNNNNWKQKTTNKPHINILHLRKICCFNAYIQHIKQPAQKRPRISDEELQLQSCCWGKYQLCPSLSSLGIQIITTSKALHQIIWQLDNCDDSNSVFFSMSFFSFHLACILKKMKNKTKQK